MNDTAVDWTTKLPEHIRGSKLVTDAKSEEIFWKRIEDQQKFLGGSIRIPTSDASPEQWAEFSEKIRTRVPTLVEMPKDDSDEAYNSVFQKLGKPDKPEKYSVDSIKDLTISGDDLSALRATAYESDLTQRQFLKMVKRVAAEDNQRKTKFTENKANDQKALRTEWGVTFDERVAKVENFLADTGAPKAVIEMVKSGGIPSEQMKWLHTMTTRMGEGTPLSDAATEAKRTGTIGNLDPLEASQRLDEIYANKAHPFHKSSHPDYKAAVARVTQLIRMVNA